MSDQVGNLSGKVGLDTTDFKTKISELNRQIRVIESGFRATSAGLEDWAKDASGLELRMDSLSKKIELQRDKIERLRAEYGRVKKEKGETSRAAQELEIKLNRETETLNKMERELKDTEESLNKLGDESKKAEKKTEDLSDAEDKAAKSSGKLGTALSKMTSVMGGAVGKIGSLAKSVAGFALNTAATVAKVAAVGAAAVTALLATTVGPASDLNETISKTETVFEGMSESIIANSKKAATAIGVDQQAYLDYASSLGAALKAGGMGVQDATALSERAVKHFADLASFHNTEVGDVAGAWDSAARGSYEPIQKYFPFITNEFMKTYGVANGLIDENTEQLTANQRAIILDAIAMDSQLNPAFGDFARTSEGLANQQRILKANLDNTKTTIGNALLPLVTKLVTGLNIFLQSDIFQSLLENFTYRLGVLAGLFEDLFELIESGGLNFENLKKLFAKGIDYMFESLDFNGISLIDIINKFFGEDVGNVLNGLVDTLFYSDFDLGDLIGKFFGGSFLKKINFIGIALDIINGLTSGLLESLPMLLPAVEKIIGSLQEFITTGFPILAETGIEILMALINGILPALPSLLEVALQAVVTLALGIAAALPTLIPTIVGIVLEIVNVLIENLPMILDAALQLILTLAEGIIAALPVLIPEIPKIIEAIFNAIIEALPMIAEAAVELILALVEGLLDSLPTLADAAVDIVETLINTIVELVPTLLDVGVSLVEGIWQGILSKKDKFAQDVKDFFGSIVGGVKDLLGIRSPSKVFAGIGGNMVSGLAVGFEDGVETLDKTIARKLGGLVHGLNVSANLQLSGTAANNQPGQTITILPGAIVLQINTSDNPTAVGAAAGKGVLASLRGLGVPA